MTDGYEDLMTTGVIDPTKVVRCEIQNAASVATLLLTSDVLIVDKPEEKERNPAAAGMEPYQNVPGTDLHHRLFICDSIVGNSLTELSNVNKEGQLKMRTSEISAFETTIQKSNAWIRELMEELNWDEPQRAYHGLRAVLHALRDRLPIAEVADLSSQLPMLIRGVFFENWRPNQTPVADRTCEQFFEHVYENCPIDMEVKAEKLVRAVFWLLSDHISEGEIEDIIRTLPKHIRELWY